MKEKSVRFVRSIAKIALLLCGIFLVLLGVYYTYRSIRFRPYKVRVSNVTDSAFTVSWVTDEPMVGVVYYGEKDTFLPGPLSWLGKKKAVDDRDVSDAQTECVSKFNKKVSKTRDENFTVDASGYDCHNVKVFKKGHYYTHHVTVGNLEAEKEYFFRVGNGYISYKNGKTEGVEYIEREMSAVSEFKSKTLSVIKNIGTPKPAYGTSFNFYRKPDGFVGMKKNFDSIIFLKTFKGGVEYPLMSAVVNTDGGWSIDMANVRDKENNLVTMEGASLEFIPQVDNARPGSNVATEYANIKFPLRILGNNNQDWGGDDRENIVEGELGARLKNLISGVLAYDDEDRVECWRIGDCQYGVYQNSCPSGYTPTKSKCKTEPVPPPKPNPLCCTSDCTCNNRYAQCPGGFTQYSSQAACQGAKQTPKVSCCSPLGQSDCVCINGQRAGSCGGSYPQEYNTNDLSEAKEQCKAKLPPVTNNCYTYKESDNSCDGPKACTSGTLSFTQCEDKRKAKLGLSEGNKTCCEIKITGGCDCKYNQKKCTGLYKEFSSRNDCKDAKVEVVGEPIKSVEGCVNGKTVPSYVPVRVTGIVNQSISQKKGPLDIFKSKIFADAPSGNSLQTVCSSAPSSSCYNYYDYQDKICRACRDDCNLCSDDNSCDDGEKLCPTVRIENVNEEITSNCELGDSGCNQYWRHTDCAVVFLNEAPGAGYTSVRSECRGSKLSIVEGSMSAHLLGNHCIVKVANGRYETAPNMTRTIVSGGCDSCYAQYTNTSTGVLCGNVRVQGVFCGNPAGEAGCNNQRVQVGKCGEECKAEGGCVCPSNCQNGGERVEKGVACSGQETSLLAEQSIEEKIQLRLGETCPQEDDGHCECIGRNHLTSYGPCKIEEQKPNKSDKCCYKLFEGHYVSIACTSSDGELYKIVQGGNTCDRTEGRDKLMKDQQESSSEGSSSESVGMNQLAFNVTEKTSCCEANDGSFFFSESSDCPAGSTTKLLHACVSRFKKLVSCYRDGEEKILQYSYPSSELQEPDCPEGRSKLNPDGLFCCSGTVYTTPQSDCGSTTFLPCFDYKGEIPSSSSNILPQKEGVSKFVKSVEANSSNNTSSTVYFPESGLYKFDTRYGGEVKYVGLEGERMIAYIERNGTPGFQSPRDLANPAEGEDLPIDSSGIILSVEQVAIIKEIKLKKGVNIISFDIFPSEGENVQLMSNRFLELVNQSGQKVSSISYFSGSQWASGNTYDFKTGEVKGTPFPLSQGKGYVVIAERDTTITVPGYKTNTPIPIPFSSGWNLIGVHGHDTSYTAKSLINSVNSVEGLKANNVTYWPTSKGMYQGFQLSEGQEYGQDFPISKDLGYFVRINDIKKECRSIWWNPDGENNGKCN